MSVVSFPGRPEGWFTELPLMEEMLKEFRRRRGLEPDDEGPIALEIGTYKGLTASLLSEYASLTTVDPHPESWEDYSAWLREAGRDIKPLRMTSQQALHELKNAAYDIIHIDGLHTYEGVKFDLENYVPLLNPGGLLLCHDYGEPSPGHDGVKRAIDEYFETRDWEKGALRYMFYAWKPLQT